MSEKVRHIDYGGMPVTYESNVRVRYFPFAPDKDPVDRLRVVDQTFLPCCINTKIYVFSTHIIASL